MKVKTCDCGCKNKKILAKGGCTPKKKKIKKNYNGGLMLEDPDFLNQIVEKFRGGGKSIKKYQTPSDSIKYEFDPKHKERFKKAELEGKTAKVPFKNSEIPLENLIIDRFALHSDNRPVWLKRESNDYDPKTGVHSYGYLMEYNPQTTDYGATMVPQLEQVINVNSKNPSAPRDTVYTMRYFTPEGTIVTQPVSSVTDSTLAPRYRELIEPVKKRIK